ncbi:M6 family metalloprotease-like protein/predicted secreted protein (Por secretion system target) [Marinilabilia salmonicolor]|uniref:M6 family metalloprotease-like protein/predicted secreted protein (Por secretion system target) n=2 Tax=Marinilabilia salmonicolor TaxID=989 RepID=A0A368UK31_9BACT|nr:M6 family metalloprotease-like protein/predicted secreted protein (Por secretion system target) [Marinilabilia salmonicolor]
MLFIRFHKRSVLQQIVGMIFQTAKNQKNMGAIFTGKKTFFLTPILIILQLFFMSFGALAVGAFPYPQEIRQPDGSVLTIRQHGDEWYNWTTTTDGFRIVRNKKGIFEYATQLKSGEIAASGIKASNPDKRATTEINFLSGTPRNIGVSRENYLKKRSSKYSGALKSSIMSTYFPTTGSPNLLLILVNFADTSPSYLQSSFDDFMNLPGYNGTGSFKDYYEEVSGGNLSITTTVTDWVTVPGSHDYYGPEAKWSEFALHAIKAASEQGIDFSQFDNDGDGVVEGIAIIHQGPGQEVTGNENDIWSHSYSFSSAGIGTTERTLNGVVVDQYTVQPELRSPDGQMNTIGVMCHEFGHNLGLPDFYDINEDTDGQHDGTGRWDIMAGGTYNGFPYGASPAHHNPFSKADLDWVDVTVIESPQSVSLEPVISSRQVLRVNSPVENEYLLIENRRKTGFDSHLYSEGMLVYHADGNLIADRRYSNTINIDHHQGFYPIAANHIINDASCPFPGTANVTELTDTSDPAMTTWSGEGFNRSITGITQVSETIHFDFMSFQDGSPLTFSAVGTDDKSISLSWTPGIQDNSELPVLLAWNTSDTFGVPVNGTAYNPGDAIEGGGTVLYYGNSVQEFIHDNLNASSEYHYAIWSDKGTTYSQSLRSSATTKSAPVSTFPWQDDFEAGLQNWRQEFISGTNSWDFTTLYVSEMAVPAYSGSAYTSFFQKTSIPKTTRLISPVLNLESGEKYTLKFRHLQPLWAPDQDELRVLIRPLSTGVWEELVHYTDDIGEWTARALELPYSEPCEIAFEGISNYGYGIGLDMVEVMNSTACQAKPDIAPANIATSNITKISADLSWTRGNGDALMILARKDANIVDLPANGTTYTANAEFGAGDNIGNNTYVLYNGPGNQISLSGLEHTTDYYLQFYEYNESNLCYQLNPATYILSTEDVFYDITFEVHDEATNPLSDAGVIFEGDTILTDATGKITRQVKHHEKFTHVDVSADGFYGKSARFIPSSSQTITLELSPFTPLAPTSLTATVDYKTVNLQWEPVINENFENYQSFSTSITGWTFEDRDLAPTYGIYTLTWPNEQNPMAYMILDVYDENLLQMEYNITAWSGSKVLAAFAAQGTQSDDWLISPPFKVKEGDFFSLVARTLANASGTQTWGNEVIEIKIRLAGESAWTSLSGTDFSVPVSWTRFEYSLADFIGQTVEIAVQNKGTDTFILLLDDIIVGPEQGALDTDPTPVFPVSPKISKTPRADREISNKEQTTARTQKSNTDPIPMFYSGNIEYAVYRDHVEIGHRTGFANINFSEVLDGLSDYEYKVKALYPYTGMESEFSNVVWAETGYTITFEVKDDTGVAIQGASVNFNNTTKTTDENGKVVFTKVPIRTGMEYVISALEFNDYQDTVNTTSNSTINVTMAVASSSIQQESSEKITVFPNPVKSKATIQHLPNTVFNISLFDLTGTQVEQKQIRGGEPAEWDFSNYKAGIYMMILQSETGAVQRLKIIKQRE